MAKDRFSKFKKSNYNYGLKYGNSYNMNHIGVGKRNELSDKQRQFILDLIKKCNNDNSIKFLRSVLLENKEPTEKQKIVIRKIIKFIQV